MVRLFFCRFSFLLIIWITIWDRKLGMAEKVHKLLDKAPKAPGYPPYGPGNPPYGREIAPPKAPPTKPPIRPPTKGARKNPLCPWLGFLYPYTCITSFVLIPFKQDSLYYFICKYMELGTNSS